MAHFRVPVQILPRTGLLDPQGAAVAAALRTLGFGEVAEVHVGRLITVDLVCASAAEARERTRAMCETLLANPVTEDFAVGEADPA